MNKVNDWYSHTLLSRLDNKHEGVIIVVMQRIHEEDLTGFLIETDVNKEWVHIKIPAIAEKNEEWVCKNSIYRRQEGEALHVARESIDHLNDLKTKLGSYVFAGQYQQRPAPIEGNTIKKHHLHRYEKLPDEPDLIFQSWDTASKTGELNDYSVGITCLVKDNKFYLAGIVREKLEYPQLKQRVIQNIKYYQERYSCKIWTSIEDKSSGIQLIQELRQEYFPVIPHNTKTNKEERLMTALPKIENGSFLLPKSAPWLADYENELLRFPHAKHDDQVDATTMILELCHQRYIARAINTKAPAEVNPEDEGSVRVHSFKSYKISEYDVVTMGGTWNPNWG